MAQVIAVPDTNLFTRSVIQRYFAFFVSPSSLTLALNASVDGGVTWTWQTLSGGPAAGILSKAAVTSFFRAAWRPTAPRSTESMHSPSGTMAIFGRR